MSTHLPVRVPVEILNFFNKNQMINFLDLSESVLSFFFNLEIHPKNRHLRHLAMSLCWLLPLALPCLGLAEPLVVAFQGRRDAGSAAYEELLAELKRQGLAERKVQIFYPKQMGSFQEMEAEVRSGLGSLLQKTEEFGWWLDDSGFVIEKSEHD